MQENSVTTSNDMELKIDVTKNQNGVTLARSVICHAACH